MATARKPRIRPLTLKQQRLVAEMPTAPNHTEAARRAGYSPNGSPGARRTSASEALTNPNVQAALKANALAAGINPVRVLKEQARAAYANPKNSPSWDHKLHALDQLGKYLRLWDTAGAGGGKPQPAPVVNIQVLLASPEAQRALDALARVYGSSVQMTKPGTKGEGGTGEGESVTGEGVQGKPSDA